MTTGSSGGAVACEDEPVHDDILQIASAVGSASVLTEGKFLTIGQGLSSSVDLLERLTALFGQLQVELDGQEMSDATAGLAEIADQVSVLAGAQQHEYAVLGRLSDIAAGLRRRIDDIYKEIRTIDVLTINARIMASSVGTTGAEFLEYIEEISQSLKVTDANLQEFRADLEQVGSHLANAAANEARFETRHAGIVAAIPQQLSENLDTITSHRRLAAISAADVNAKSREVASGVSRVVIALQIGDTTRQRMEHAQEAAELFARIIHSGACDVENEPWSGLTAFERHALAAAGCAEQAAQLSDAADEFGRETASIRASLKDLVAGAHEILRLGQLVYGAANHERQPFLEALETDVNQTHAVLAGFQVARESADKTITSVLEIATRLAEHIGTVRVVEDIRILGINATLKSSRLGAIGRPLSVVADELTASSDRAATEAKAATVDVENIVHSVKLLADQQQTGQVSGISAITLRMTQSANRLRNAAVSLASAFNALTQDGAAVVALLDKTAIDLAAIEEIDVALRSAASRFAEAAEPTGRRLAPPDVASRRMFELIAARHTMARERDVHARFASRFGVVAAAAQPQELDDILF